MTSIETNKDLGKKFCKHCGEKIDKECIICPKCGKQVEEIKISGTEQPNIVINNTNTNVNQNVNSSMMYMGKPKNKYVALLLCIFLGYLGAHKFYEGKIGMGILYICTCGLCGIGWVVDIVLLICKPNPYYI